MVGRRQQLLLQQWFVVPVAPGGMCGRCISEFLRGQVALAQQQQDGAWKRAPALRHAVLETGGGHQRAASHGAQVAAQRAQGLPADAAGQQLAPEGGLQQALAVVMLDLGACQAGFGADPGVEQGEAGQAGALGDIGETVSLVRRKSAHDVAIQAGITRVTPRRAEAGEPAVTMATYVRVLAALGLAQDLVLVARDDVAGRHLPDKQLQRPARVKPQAAIRVADYPLLHEVFIFA